MYHLQPVNIKIIDVRPDIIDSRFQQALLGNGGESGDLTWNIFDHTQNPIELIDFVRGAEISSKDGGLTTLDAIARSSFNDFNYAFWCSD